MQQALGGSRTRGMSGHRFATAQPLVVPAGLSMADVSSNVATRRTRQRRKRPATLPSQARGSLRSLPAGMGDLGIRATDIGTIMFLNRALVRKAQTHFNSGRQPICH